MQSPADPKDNSRQVEAMLQKFKLRTYTHDVARLIKENSLSKADLTKIDPRIVKEALAAKEDEEINVEYNIRPGQSPFLGNLAHGIAPDEAKLEKQVKDDFFDLDTISKSPLVQKNKFPQQEQQT